MLSQAYCCHELFGLNANPKCALNPSQTSNNIIKAGSSRLDYWLAIQQSKGIAFTLTDYLELVDDMSQIIR
ncbi:hypothetical protein GCM10007922_03560 [Shewanella decolorationis]|nr:hypothetical protein GCM10007922_03560 [Shewanella decolorationis]